MKKLLIGTTALVAVGVAAPVMAAEPIKLGVGGFMHQWVGYSTQSSGFKAQTTTSAGDNREYVKFDSKSAGEFHFTGSTKLDNGLTVKAHVEMEAEQGAASSIDMSYVDITSPTLGQLQVGKLLPANFLVRHVATHYGIGYNGSDGGGTPTAWVIAPAAVTYTALTTGFGSAAKDQMINYFSPRWEGFGVAFHFDPNYSSTAAATQGGNQYQVPGGGTAGSGSHRKAWSYNAVYDNTIDGWKLGANLGYWATSGADTYADFRTWNYGLSVGYAGFTLTHSFANNSNSGKYTNQGNNNTGTTGSNDGTSYDIGLAYANGPWGVAYFYQRSKLEGNTTIAADDKVTYNHLSAKYTLGPGIDLKSSLFHIKYDDETTTAANTNKGWGLVAGMAITF